MDVENIEKKTHDDFSIKSILFITGKIREFAINDESAQAFNRDLSALINCLVNFIR